MARIGYAAVAAAALLWAAGATVAGRLFERGASPVELTAARSWIAVAGIGAIVAARPRARERARPAVILLFGLSIAGANYSYYLAISRLPVAIAIVIQYTAPGIVVAWAALGARRAPPPRLLAALGLALAGVALLAELPLMGRHDGLRLDALGIGAALVSAVAFAAYILLGEGLGGALGPAGAMVRGFAVASVFWAIVVAARGRPDTLPDASFLPGIAFVGIGATIAPFLLFLWGLGRIGAARAGIVSTLEPLAAAFFAFTWLDQSLSAMQILGSVMVVAGIAVVRAERPPPAEVLADVAAVE